MQKTYNYIRQLFSQYPFFLLLLPLFFIYSGYNELFGFLPFGYVMKNLLVILVATAGILLFSVLAYNNKTKASLFTFFVILISLIFGFLHDSLKMISASEFITKYTVIIPAVFLFLLTLYWAIRRTKKNFSSLFLFLNLLFLILILSEIPNSIKRRNLDKSVHNLLDFRFTAFNDYKPSVRTTDSSKPDIFFLVFDALGSTKSIHKNLNFNNQHLDSFLIANKFQVIPDVKANYNWTIYSISSMLNMDYLPGWISPVMNEPKIHFWGTEALKNNSLFQILHEENYEIYNYQPLSFNNPDWPGSPFFNYFKTQHYYFKTLPGRIHRDLFWNFTSVDISLIKKQQIAAIQKRNLQQKHFLDTTLKLVKKACSVNSSPKFVYGHFMVTHDPYLYNGNGELMGAEQSLVESQKFSPENYCNQLRVADSLIKDLVLHIKKFNKSNTIILIMGDHGFPSEIIGQSGYSFEVFNSYYFPDQNYSVLKDSTYPINTFRKILNQYFNTHYKMLKDTSVFVTTESELINKHKLPE